MLYAVIGIAVIAIVLLVSAIGVWWGGKRHGRTASGQLLYRASAQAGTRGGKQSHGIDDAPASSRYPGGGGPG